MTLAPESRLGPYVILAMLGAGGMVIDRGGRSRWAWAAAAAAVVALGAGLIAWWRIPSPVPVVESVTQLTDDGQPKLWMVSDGSRIYFSERRNGSWKIAQV